MKVDFNDVMKVLNNNGIDEKYFEDMGGREIEMGCVEWVDTLCEITGKYVYEEDIDEEDDKKITQFVEIIEANGIIFV
jgi:hypothetical protein